MTLSKLKQEGRELLHCTPIHYSCGNNDEEFIKGNKENEKDKCCDCYPHKSCSVAKEVKGVLVQLEPFLTAQIEKAYLSALSDVKKWTKGRNVTKDSLREVINKLKESK